MMGTGSAANNPQNFDSEGKLLVSATTTAGGGSVAAAFTTGQNALSTAAEVVVAANTARRYAEVTNTDAAILVYLGKDNTVTTANGHVLGAGKSFGFEGYTGAIWAIAASGTPNVTFVEW
jgi:hypothetical protein